MKPGSIRGRKATIALAKLTDISAFAAPPLGT
jgi:hypothetical protein